MLLVYVSELNGFANLECAAISIIKSHDKTEESGFTSSVRANNTYDAVRRKHEVEVVEQYLFAESLLHMLSLDNFVAQAWSVRNKDFKLLLAFLLLLVEHLLIRVKTSLTLCLTSLRSHAYPFELSLKCLLTLRSRLLFLCHALCLLVEP